ncbi:hypothetical protein SPRG_10294 [Saprolegnia parasitica CBS 223.65]|uniref:Uncharacterized protein n=1 Tax=Saprolegnia parasitica (strain CBS 223.65) TaxID=695850 RepID=A0A067C1Q6_SAPPC|nr:hypothetical protein SPRG_10294 [Saprolegnia parasitica CBS 223.65]KDO24478.1 hypothetical protein SPRG_10294 [Saprolegnia parasitica CBS 223.65]|eukprot:XP_012204744.1 hypothetical protein SPRG_10294 [Saprolegnia parasitica CBS 223.65]
MTVHKPNKRRDSATKRQRNKPPTEAPSSRPQLPPLEIHAPPSAVAITSPIMIAARPPPLVIPPLVTPAASPTPRRTPSSRPSSPRQKVNLAPPPQRALLVDFLYREVFGIMEIKESEGPHNQQRVVNFLKSFVEIEKLVLYGLLLCIDSFIYVFTYLPLRIVLALGSGVVSLFYKRTFRRSHMHDMLLAIIMVLSTSVLYQVDMSRVYHLIRGQALIKLYVLFTMLEIVDKLFCSLGQDVLDAMYFTSLRRYPFRLHLLMLGRILLLFSCYMCVLLHSLLLFGQVVTMNVAIHSSSTSLLTLLISNNFAELKTSVFKKFEEQNLFQIACSDIVERFKLMLIIGLILLQSDGKDVADGTAMVLLAEMLIDWIKHAFITKFNQIPPSVYSKFMTILCRDVSGYRSDSTIQDHTQFVSRRLGLISLPLACVTVRMVHEALKDAETAASLEGDWAFTMSRPAWMCILVLGFFCLSAFKVLLSLWLMVHACTSGRLSSSWKSAPPSSPRARAPRENTPVADPTTRFSI